MSVAEYDQPYEGALFAQLPARFRVPHQTPHRPELSIILAFDRPKSMHNMENVQLTEVRPMAKMIVRLKSQESRSLETSTLVHSNHG